MTQGILEFPSFLSAGLPAGLTAAGLSAGSVRGYFLRVLAWGAAKYKGQRKSRIPSINLEFLSLVSSPDLIRGSHHRDPRVKPEEDIVRNSRIPKTKSKILRDCFGRFTSSQ